MIQRNSQNVFGLCQRGRKIMLIGRQSSTRSGSCSIQFFPRFLVGYLWRWRPAISALCRDLIKKNPYAFRISQDYTRMIKKRSCPKFQIKKTLPLKHGQINATISQVPMFHKFLYIITISLEHPRKLLSSSPWVRAFMLIGRQDYTKLPVAPALLLVQMVRDA